MSLTTKRFTFGVISFIALVAVMSCGDNVEFVVPLETSIRETAPDASTQDTDEEAQTSPDAGLPE